MSDPSRSSQLAPLGPLLNDNSSATVHYHVEECQACKETQRKCDGGRPTCMTCARRRAFCRYGNVKLISAHVDPPDERPRKKPKSAAPIRLPPILDRPVASDRTKQLVDPPSDSTVAFQSPATTNDAPVDIRNETFVPSRHSALSLGQALHKSDDVTHRASSISNASSHEPSAPQSVASGRDSNQNRHPSTSFFHASLDVLGPSLTPATRQILANPNAQQLLDFFRFHTVSTWHPQLPTIANNGAVAWLLPMALEHPVVLEALLTQAAAQRLFHEPEQRMAMEMHKAHCVELICQHGCLQAQGNGSGYAIEVLAATGALITAAVDVRGSNDWAEYCQRARLYLKPVAMPVDESHAYVYNRLLKQLCFSEIARPTWHEVPLLDTIQGNQQDEAFGLPGLGLKLVTLIARCSFQHGSSVTLINDRAQMEQLLRDYARQAPMLLPASFISEWQAVQEIWRLTTDLFYRRTLLGARHDEPSCITLLARIIEFVHLISPRGVYGSALALPMLTIAPLIQPHGRDWFERTLTAFAKSSTKGSYYSILVLAKACWVAIDQGHCRTMTGVRYLEAIHGLNILAS